MIENGIILAAGLGKRMQPLTNDKPKPMVTVKGKPIIDYALEAYAEHGVRRVVVNTHYKADVLTGHIKNKDWPFELMISHEPQLLDTGGGLKKAQSVLDSDAPYFVLSGDSILIDGLRDLENAWKPDMDVLLSLQPLASMKLTPATGDYRIVNGKPLRTPDHSGNYMWNSARIVNPTVFKNTPDGPFSFLSILDDCESKGTLACVVHTGTWHHLTTPEDILNVEKGWQP